MSRKLLAVCILNATLRTKCSDRCNMDCGTNIFRIHGMDFTCRNQRASVCTLRGSRQQFCIDRHSVVRCTIVGEYRLYLSWFTCVVEFRPDKGSGRCCMHFAAVLFSGMAFMFAVITVLIYCGLLGRGSVDTRMSRELTWDEHRECLPRQTVQVRE